MKKIAVIEKIHKDGLEIIDKDPDYEYELMYDWGGGAPPRDSSCK